MRIITCASYYGSGSSAITDLFSEFDNVKSFTDWEFRFVHDPDGISDLEYNLVENFNRHNSGHAIKRFKKLVDQNSHYLFKSNYEQFLNNNWKKKAYAYIDSLVDFQYHGWWHYDLIDRGFLFHFRKRILNKILHFTIWRNNPERTLNTMKNEITYCSHPTEEDFLNKTRYFIDDLFKSVANDKNTIVVDQLVPPTNTSRYIRYFNDIKIVIVDRDPRDIYVLAKFVWKDGIIPTNINEYCKWYKYTREHRKTDVLDKERVKYVQFEDLIYNYEDTVSGLIKWVELDEKNHTKKKQYLVPENSVNNTQLWKKFDCVEEIKIIENELKEYLYNYE